MLLQVLVDLYLLYELQVLMASFEVVENVSYVNQGVQIETLI